MRLKRLLIVLLLLTLTVSGTIRALDDNEFGGYPSDTLSIQVGYAGGPFYEKRLFTLAELEAMDVVYADYTFIDNMPSVIIAHVKGVRLADIVDAAGIDVGNVSRFHFWISDKSEGSYTSFSKSELLDTVRYCYYSLPDNFDYDTGAGNEYATVDRERVDTVIALADDWGRALAGASFGSDYLNLNSNTRFRLIFGQTDAVTNTASRSAKWVYAISVELRGEPSISLAEPEISLFAGREYKPEPQIEADSAIIENTPVVWSSSDSRVARVAEDGTITAVRAGSAVITAEFLGASATITVNVPRPASNSQPTTGATGKGGGTAVSPGASAPLTSGTEVTSDVETDAPHETPPPKQDETPEPTLPPTPEPTPSPTPEEPPPPEPEDTVSILPILGIAAISVFAAGSVIARLLTRNNKRRGSSDNDKENDE